MATVLGHEELNRLKELEPEKRAGELRKLFAGGPPTKLKNHVQGRYWYLPKFLAIDHRFCDFMQVDSIAMADLESQFESLATLASPYAESLQACWTSFDAAVGLTTIRAESIQSVLEE